MKSYTEEEVLNSLFESDKTLALEGIEIKDHRKNAVNIYFTYKGKEYCFTKRNIIAKFSDIEGQRFFQYAVLDFEDKEYREVVECLKDKLARN